MKKLVKFLSVVCVASLISTSLMGCGDKKASTTESTTTESTTQTVVTEATESKPVTLRFSWWGRDARHKATLDTIAAYKNKFPDVTIEGEYAGFDGYQQKLLTQLAGGSEPDLMQIDSSWMAQLAGQKDNFVDLGVEKAIDLTQFETKLIQDFCSTNGYVIGLPMGINGFGIQMNKTFLKKFNIPLDTQWTWEKLIEEGKKVHAADKESYLFMAEQGELSGMVFSDYLRGKTGKYWATDDYVINATKDDLIDAFKLIKNLFDSGTAAPYGETTLYNGKSDQYPKFINGQIGMTEEWSGTISKYKTAIKPENFGVMSAITVTNGKDLSTTYKPSVLLAISKKSSNAQEAVKFANWMLNDKEAALILKDQRSIPASTASRQALIDANALDSDIAQMVTDTLKNPASPVPAILSNSEVTAIVQDICAKVVFAKSTPEKSADEFLSLLTDKINSLKPKK